MSAAPTLSVQLYSGRFFPPMEAQVAAAAAAGFAAVETFAPFHEDPVATARLLARHGLSAPSGHFALDLAEGEPARVADAAKVLGMTFAVVPYLPPSARPTDPAGWLRLGARLGAIAERLGREGLRVAWHNHDFEFRPLADGSLPIEHVLGDGLLWEADLAWIARGGADPATWLDRYRGRVPLVHVKDIARPGVAADEDGWADLGTGVLPWPDLWRRCRDAGAEILIAEHDRPSDFARFARNSAAAMRALAGEGAR